MNEKEKREALRTKEECDLAVSLSNEAGFTSDFALEHATRQHASLTGADEQVDYDPDTYRCSPEVAAQLVNAAALFCVAAELRRIRWNQERENNRE